VWEYSKTKGRRWRGDGGGRGGGVGGGVGEGGGTIHKEVTMFQTKDNDGQYK
jgi:hypothetical protein